MEPSVKAELYEEFLYDSVSLSSFTVQLKPIMRGVCLDGGLAAAAAALMTEADGLVMPQGLPLLGGSPCCYKYRAGSHSGASFACKLEAITGQRGCHGDQKHFFSKPMSVFSGGPISQLLNRAPQGVVGQQGPSSGWARDVESSHSGGKRLTSGPFLPPPSSAPLSIWTCSISTASLCRVRSPPGPEPS